MLCFDLSSFVEQLYDKVSCTIMRFDSSSSLEQTFEDGSAIFV